MKKRILLTAVAFSAVTLATSMLATGAFGVFGDSGEATLEAGTGTVQVTWNDTGANEVSLPIGPLTPGMSEQAVLTMDNAGATDVSQIQIAITGMNTGSASDGVQLLIESCSVPWGGAAPIFSCAGSMVVVSPDRPVTATITLTNSSVMIAGGHGYLRFTYRLSDSAPRSMEHEVGNISLVITGIQRSERKS